MFYCQLLKYGIVLGAFGLLMVCALGYLATVLTLDPLRQDSLMGSLETMRRDLATLISGIHDGSESSDGAVREIAQANADLSARTQHQAASLEESAASIEQLTATVAHNAENTQHASSLARDSGTALDNSRRLVVMSSMRWIISAAMQTKFWKSRRSSTA